MPRHVAKHHGKAAGHARRSAHGKSARTRKPVRTKKPVATEQPAAAAGEPRVIGVLEIEMAASPEIPEFEEESAFTFPLVEDTFTTEEEA